ncbi:MAG: hypothetical protein ACTSRG_08320 [Candidatus Helarchaeota archaeon]
MGFERMDVKVKNSQDKQNYKAIFLSLVQYIIRLIAKLIIYGYTQT